MSTDITTNPKPATPFALRAVVRWHGDGAQPREEVSGLLNVTPQGATLLLANPPDPGQLLCLQLPGARGNPQGMKMYALAWAVAGTGETEETEEEAHRHSVSVIFVDEAPGGGRTEALISYDYLIDEEGRLRLQRQQAEKLRRGRDQLRRESRLSVPVEVLLEALRPDGTTLMREQTVTENISRSGASVWTSLMIGAKQPVRLTSERYGVSLDAVVRARRIGEDGIARLHIEFTDSQWPLEKIT